MFKEFKYNILEGKPDGFKFTAKLRCGSYVNCIYSSFNKNIWLVESYENRNIQSPSWFYDGRYGIGMINTQLDIVAYEVPDPEVEVGKTYIAVGPNILQSDKVEVEIIKKDGELFVGLCYKLKIILLFDKHGIAKIWHSETIDRLIINE